MRLTPVRVAEYAKSAGFKDGSLVTAVAVATAESKLDPQASNGPYKGLWQIGANHVSSPETLTNPAVNAKVAYQLSSHGTNWSQWGAYTSGAYRQFLKLAEDAVLFIEIQPLRTNGMTAIHVPGNPGASVYFPWIILRQAHVNYRYLGNQQVLVGRNVVQGIQHRGQLYIPWNTVPGLQARRGAQGGYTFTEERPLAIVNGHPRIFSVNTSASSL